jgi:hypothetical protein
VLAAVLSTGVAVADVVERRGDEPSLQGTVVSLDGAGVKMRTASGALHAVPWDRVREVQCDPVLAAELKTWMPVAEDLWRARSRLQRRDTTMAEPLLERLFERYRGQTHETALVVAEGLLRCRLARADHGLAVIPALETARLRRAGITTDSYAGLSQVFDETHALCPLLAPVWVDSPFLHALERDLGVYDAQGDAVVTALAQLYRKAVLRRRGDRLRPPGARPQPPAAGAAFAARVGGELVPLLHRDVASRRGGAGASPSGDPGAAPPPGPLLRHPAVPGRARPGPRRFRPRANR